MEDNAKNLTAEESLLFITRMIRNAQGKVQRNTFFFLLWGWIVIIANLGMFVLTKAGYEHPYVVWLITIPAWLYTMYKAFKRQSQPRSATTHFDLISAWLWISYSVVIFTLVVFGSKINYELNAIILIMTSLPTLVSGAILRFRPLMLGGAAFWVFGIVCFLVPKEFQPLVGAAAILVGYLIPGYLLKGVKED